MFSNILVALDGSELSQRALIETVDQARKWNAKIQAKYVIQPTSMYASNPMGQPFGTDSAFETYRFLEEVGVAILK